MDRVQDIVGEAKVVWRGQSWRLPRPNLRSEIAMKDWLEDRAMQTFERRRGRMHPETYRTHISVWQRDCAAGVYAYGTEAFDKALRDPEAMQHWLWLALTQVKEQQTLTESQMRQMWQDCSDVVDGVEITGMQLVAALNLAMQPCPPTPPPVTAGAQDDTSPLSCSA